jgi:DNA-binding transcriptional LysR family regulator
LIAHRCAHNNYILPLSDITFTGPNGIVQIPPIRPIVLSNSIWMIREAALSGDCVAILPIYAIVDELRNGALLPVFEDFRVSAAMLNAFYRRSPRLPAKVRMLLRFLAEQYEGEPPWEQRLFGDRPQLRRVVYGPSPAPKNTEEKTKRTLRGVAS